MVTKYNKDNIVAGASVRDGKGNRIDTTYQPVIDDLETIRSNASNVFNKQDILVSGTNIKTINNKSLLGEGNIDIESGGTTIDDTTSSTTTVYSSNKTEILLSGKQDEITETNKLSADLVDDNSTTNKFVTSTEKTTWNGKQDTISDLDTIRSGANLGATALQKVPDEYITETELSEYHDSTKQDTISDLETIRSDATSGKNASDTIATYGDIVTSNKSDFQIAGDYATNTDLNKKQDIITDLETIRSGAEKGATALQEVPSEYITETELSEYHDSTKQDTLVSGTNIKSINNQSLLGSGNIEIETGASDYDNLENRPQINSVTLTGNKSLDDLGIQPKGDYALSSDIPDVSNFITKDVDDLTNYTKTDDLGMMAFADKVTNGDIDGTINQDKITDLATTFSGKQDVISDLETIRSNASEVVNKQDKLTEGDNIVIDSNKINAMSSEYVNTSWTEITLPTSAYWHSVCYGDGKFVAVAYNSTSVAYSTDGINWTESTLPVSAYWHSVCYGDGKFVAVAYTSTSVAYSTDGINWAQSTLPTSAEWESVCYGNGKFVAVAEDKSTGAYSTDGINWAQSTLPVSAYWYSVCYGNGKFVAVASGPSTIGAYSTDGINWAQSTLPVSAYWHSVCYGDGKFVAVAYNSTSVAYSTDGINWTESTLPVSAYWHSVCYGDGKFVAVAYTSTSVAYSTDGINWAQSTLPVSAYWYSVCYGNGKFVAVASRSTIGAYSPMTIVHLTNQIANCDLSNLSDNGQAKVVNTRFDGQWVAITDSATHPLISTSGTKSLEIDISSYIPSDGYLYEVMVHLAGYDNDSTYGYYLESDIFQPFTLSTTNSLALNQIYGGTYARQTNNTLILPVKQYLYLYGAGADNVYVSLMGYRRIGTNI